VTDPGRYRQGTYRGRRWCGSAFSGPTIRCTCSRAAAQVARSAGSKRSSTRRSSRRRRVLTCRTTRRPEAVSSSVTTLRLPESAPRTRCPEACSRSASLVTDEPCTPSAWAHCVELERPCWCRTRSRRNWESEISNASTLRSASPTRSRVATSKVTNSLADVFAGSPCSIPGSMARARPPSRRRHDATEGDGGTSCPPSAGTLSPLRAAPPSTRGTRAQGRPSGGMEFWSSSGQVLRLLISP